MSCALTLTCLLKYTIIGIVPYLVYKWWKKIAAAKQYELFRNTPKDTVIVHGFPMVSIPLPTCVPWDIKVRTFCFMNNIKHETDDKYPWGPTQKTPWISLNGVHMGDSQLIVEYLSKKFEVDMNAGYSDEQLAVSRAVRIMLEERWYWAMPLWRWVRDDGHAQWYKDFARMRDKFPRPLPLVLLRKYFGNLLGNEANGHGVGRHSPEERLEMFKGDLRTTSVVLGAKKFILGDKPCLDDCAIFGQISQAVWGLPNSPYEKYINEELPNLKAYCERIKEVFWKDAWVSGLDTWK